MPVIIALAMNRFVVDVVRQTAIPTMVTDAANPSSATGTGPTVA